MGQFASRCCPSHGCAVTCFGEDGDAVLAGLCPWDGERIEMTAVGAVNAPSLQPFHAYAHPPGALPVNADATSGHADGIVVVDPNPVLEAPAATVIKPFAEFPAEPARVSTHALEEDEHGE